MICFPYVLERYESEAILNLVWGGGEIFLAKAAVALTERLAILLNICRVLRKVRADPGNGPCQQKVLAEYTNNKKQ